MKIIKNVNSEDILTLDIETVRLYENLKDAPLEMQSAWEKKNTNEGETPDFITLSDLWNKKAPLYAEFSKVCAISISYLNSDQQLKVKTYFGENEKEILESFSSDLALFYATNKAYRSLGHASKYFDFPFLCKRYIINQLDIPSSIDESNSKPWDMKNLDTNDLWRSFGTGPGSSLQALCCVLNVPTSKVDLVGDQVGEAYYNGELERIASYCSMDVVSTFNVFRRFKKEEIFEFEDAIYIFQNGAGEKQTVNLTDHILASSEVSSRSADIIAEEFKNDNRETKEIALELVKAAVSNGREGNKVEEEDTQDLKEKLGLQRDYAPIQVVVDKGNLGKKQSDVLIELYNHETEERKQEIVTLVEQFLTEKGKINQTRTKNALEHLKANL